MCEVDLYSVFCISVFILSLFFIFFFFFFNDTATTEIYTLSLHDALPIFPDLGQCFAAKDDQLTPTARIAVGASRSEEHTSELQSLAYLVCRLLLEKKKNNITHLQSHHEMTTHVRYTHAAQQYQNVYRKLS